MLGLEPNIVFQHSEFLVINKPIGWTIQRDDNAPSLLAWVQEQSGKKGFPVHRLDKPTSGVIIIATSEAANRNLSQQFQARSISKTYLAISDAKPKKKQGWVKGDMKPSRRSQWKLLRTLETPAITQFKTESINERLRGFYLFPKTGKTHQLRVAMKSLGSPILGDALYGGSEAERLYLHAWQIGFQFDGELHQFKVTPEGGLFDSWPMGNSRTLESEVT